MSIKMTLSGALKKTSGSNFNQEWSALTWVRWDSFPGTDIFACILSKDNANAFSVLEYLNGWVRTNIWGPNYVNLHQPQLRTWYCYFMTEKMPQNTWNNARAGYIKYGERRWTTISSWSNNVGDVSCDMFFGGNGWNETIDAHMQIAKYWKANLTDEELMREAYSLMPLREANLYFANTLDTYRDAQRDMSGNGNHFNNASVLPKSGGYPGPIKRPSGIALPEYHWESTANDWCEMKLSSVTDPSTDSGYILRVRRYKSGTKTIKHVYAIVQGSTVIQEFEDPVVPEGVSDISFSVTNASAITDHSDIRYRVRAIKVS